MTRTMRLILLGCIGLAILGALIWTAFRPVSVPVELAEATRGPMSVTVDVDGVTRIRDVWEVYAPISGTALRSPVEVGDRVEESVSVVAVVEPVTPSLLDARSRSQAEAAIHEAEAALEVARSRVRQAGEDLAYARGQYERAQALVERGVASLVRLEDAAQALAVSEAAQASAEAAEVMASSTLERARAALIGPDEVSGREANCCVEILAPADGAVLEIDSVSERGVAAGARLLSIGEPTNLEIVADPLTRDAVRIPADARATVSRWGGEGTLAARLRRIEPRARTEISALGIEEQRVESIFDFVDPPEARAGLADGYALRLAIEVWSTDDTLRVPLGAAFRSGDGWAVYTVESDRAALTEITIGQRNDRVVEVLAGLEEGARVILHPGNDIRDGVGVSPIVRAPSD